MITLLLLSLTVPIYEFIWMKSMRIGKKLISNQIYSNRAFHHMLITINSPRQMVSTLRNAIEHFTRLLMKDLWAAIWPLNVSLLCVFRALVGAANDGHHLLKRLQRTPCCDIILAYIQLEWINRLSARQFECE